VEKQTKVFILGAGCSAECGYPLGVGFAAELEKFLGEIREVCPVIKQCVTDTLKLLVGLPEIETLDQLAKHLEDELRMWQHNHGGFIISNPKEYSEKLSLVQKRIRDAKIATSALFCAKEAKARKMPAFQRYKLLITEIFGGYPWQDGIREADCHVLTFNYDRLFEIAFLECFRDFDSGNTFVYGKDALNSGFNLSGMDYSTVSIASDHFCFLKLHGSASWWGQQDKHNQNGRRYYFTLPLKTASLEEIEKSIPKERDVQYGCESLIVFPHERQFSQEFHKARGESSGYPWAQYVDTIWSYAATVLEAATEVRVIGYSFNPIDSRYVVDNLIAKVKSDKIVIQNLNIDTVKKNPASYKMLRERLEFDQMPF
jgi:hypothetical protein